MRRQRSKTHPAAATPRPSRRIDADADPFGTSERPPEPAACPRCGAVVREGRWVWGSAAHGAAAVECPACRRIAQDLPDGVVTVSGGFVTAHETELRGLVHHVEENEKRNHALARIFGIDAEGTGLVVKTTERRLAESIGRALERAYGGTLEHVEGDKSSPLRVHWQRD
jgi:NMD protein affecting ribosome stability and mRNA decay